MSPGVQGHPTVSGKHWYTFSLLDLSLEEPYRYEYPIVL